MAKLTICKTCGAQISSDAKACPSYGAKVKKPKIWLWVIVGVLVLGVIGGAFGSSADKPQPVGSSTENSERVTSSLPDKETAAVEAAPEKTSFGIGEAAEYRDIIVTLNSVTESNGNGVFKPEDGKVFLLCEFTIENNSSSDLAVSSMLSFEAYADDYSASMNLSATVSSDKNQLDGSVASGKKMNGVIGYEVLNDWSNFEIRFQPNVWSSKSFIFSVSKDSIVK